jgi:hypothetical protein
MDIKEKYFTKEKDFFDKFGLLSVINYEDSHKLTPKELSSKKNTESVLIISTYQNDKEFITDYICSVQKKFYIYLSSTIMESSYKLRIYYSPNDIAEIKMLIQNLKND